MSPFVRLFSSFPLPWASGFLLSLAFLACREAAPSEPIRPNVVERVLPNAIALRGGASLDLAEKDLRARFFLLRHAEKDTVGRDPGLQPAGLARAERLAAILGELPLRRIYSTNFQRTRLTVSPLARALHLPTQSYAAANQKALLDQLLEQAPGGQYLLVGHSNTVPQMLNYLSGKAVYTDIPEAVYDRFYVASVFRDGRVAVLDLQY
ncbi:MAG: phosphoglycerate mutase family protein [Bacteroidota bacterium]